MILPHVTVIIPAYNAAAYLTEALESVVSQNYPSFDVVVVDDGSADNTAGVMKGFPGAQYIRQPNQGAATARNTGIQAARGELLAFLDADDVWMPGKLRVQVDFLAERPELGFCVSLQELFFQPGIQLPPGHKRELVGTSPVAYIPSALLIRREIFDRVGLFDPTYRKAEDTEWFLRAEDDGVRMAVVQQVLLRKRLHDTNQTLFTDPRIVLRLLKRSVDRRKARGKESGGV